MKKIIISFLFVFFATLCSAQNLNFNYTQTCFGDQTLFAATSTLPDDSIQSWQWNMQAKGTYELSGKQIIYFFDTISTFAVTLKITSKSGSVDSITKNVIINPLPNVNFHVDNLCEKKEATYFNLSTIVSGNISQFLWDFDNNGIVDNNSNDTVKYTCGPAQTYITKLTCVSDKGCRAFATKTTEVYPQPTALFSSSNTCFGDTAKFINASINTSPDYYLWNFGDNNQITTPENPSHIYQHAGLYNVSLVAVSMYGCRDTATATIEINTPPVISITTSGDTVLYQGESLVLTVNGSNNYVWNTAETNNSIIVTQSADYSVTGTDAKGCKSIARINIKTIAMPQSIVVSSNILTPNGDGINDYLVIENIEAYQSCILKIYSMWNAEVFHSEKYTNNWDGRTSEGKLLSEGSYYYIISCDEKPVLTGNINILLQ